MANLSRRRPSRATSNIRMHLTSYSGLRPLPPAGDAGRSAAMSMERSWQTRWSDGELQRGTLLRFRDSAFD